MYFVYVIYNRSSQKSYTGQTIDLKKRLNEHNEHLLGGFTSRYRGEWVLIYKESVATRSEALKREKQLKSGNGRAFIKQLFRGSSAVERVAVVTSSYSKCSLRQ